MKSTSVVPSYTVKSGEYLAAADNPSTELILWLDDVSGNGAVVSTVGDLYRWDRALANNTLFDAETTELLFTPGKTNSGASTNYAFGWATGEIPGVGKILQHGGGSTGFMTGNEFFLKAVNAQLVFRAGSDGKIVSATLFQGGREISAKKE